MSFKIGEEFKPNPEFKQLYYIYLLILVLTHLAILIPVSIVVFMYSTAEIGIIFTSSVFLLLFIPVAFAAYWIGKYYESISYRLTASEIIVKRGVWWKKVKFVPYNRITNLEIHQGPISRKLGLARISIQTAGYSYGGGQGRGAEASILGVKNYEEVKEAILKFVRRFKPVAVEAEEAEPEVTATLNQQVIEELTKIRKLLERALGKAEND